MNLKKPDQIRSTMASVGTETKTSHERCCECITVVRHFKTAKGPGEGSRTYNTPSMNAYGLPRRKAL